MNANETAHEPVYSMIQQMGSLTCQQGIGAENTPWDLLSSPATGSSRQTSP
jgi:hypothetical protein